MRPSGNLTDLIVARIEELIDRDELAAGTRLPGERDLARLLGVSRPALREAVKTLEAHGRLDVRHGQGVFVVQSAEEAMRARLANLEVSLSELFAMREVLEAPAAEWAASSASEAEIAALATALEDEKAARQPPVDFDHLATLDAAFHLHIVGVAKNRFLAQTVGVLQEMLARGMQTTLRIPGRIERSARDHREIFAAIERHDPAAARAAVVAHVTGAREAALERIRQEANELRPRRRTRRAPKRAVEG
ncbi:MAG TPA: FCD domain-containing protein [Acidimicrobiales bacterium]|nr:FCD domain-containing protein [Acidimicrobiales bacterium]